MEIFVVFVVPRPFRQDSLPFLLLRHFSFHQTLPLSPHPSPNCRSLRIRCQKKQVAAPRIPLDQRWMFEESELDGPVNAKKVSVSGKKRTQKLYRSYSGRPGGMKVETFDQLQRRIPERIIEHAVRGMLPKGRECSILYSNLQHN